MGLKMSEILLILFFGMLLFGTGKVAGLGSSLGQAIRNFKKGINGEDEQPVAKPALQTANTVEGAGASHQTANVTKES